MPLPAIVPFLARIALAVAMQVIGYMLMPKPKEPKPPSAEDWPEPTAEAGRPIPVLFGSVTVTGLNVLNTADKDIDSRKVEVSKK